MAQHASPKPICHKEQSRAQLKSVSADVTRILPLSNWFSRSSLFSKPIFCFYNSKHFCDCHSERSEESHDKLHTWILRSLRSLRMTCLTFTPLVQPPAPRSEEHTSELQSPVHLV